MDVDYKSTEIIKAIKYSLNNQNLSKNVVIHEIHTTLAMQEKIVKILLKIKINQKTYYKKMQNKGLVRNGWYK